MHPTSLLQSIPDSIQPAHWQEWLESAVDPGIIALNVESLADTATDDYTREASFPIHTRLNWKETRFGYSARPNLQGWWVSGVDPQNWERMEWGRFKPDKATPVIDKKKGEAAKYLSPASGHGSSRLVLLDVPRHIWQLIADRYDVPIEPGEEKLGFWAWVVAHTSIPIIVIEGEKKAGCLLTQGYAAIALPGITGGVRTRDRLGNPLMQPYIIPDLELFIREGRPVYICFDHETKQKTLWAVQREVSKLGRLVERAKALPRVISLPGPEKGADDFIVAQGAEAFHRCYREAVPFWQWQTRQYNQLTYKPTVRLNQRYLELPTIPQDAKLICIKSAKGTGKTQSYIDVVQQAMNQGQRVILLGHRVQLVHAISDRVGIPYITELRSSGEGELFGYGLCIDSLHPESQARFNAEFWKNAIVIIDESEQVWWHLLSADTEVRKHRIEILSQLKELLLNALESEDGKIYLSDADLTDLSIDFVRDLTGVRIKPHLIVNDWQPGEEAWTVHHYNHTKPQQLLTNLCTHIEEGGKPFVVTHSQKPKSLWSTSTLEAFLQARYPDKKILRIDSQSIADPENPAYGCVQNLNQILGQYDIVLASPSIETGVSIDLRGHFTSVWALFLGVCAENSARQSLARVREPVDRHVWIAPRGVSKVGNESTSHKLILRSQERLSSANLSLLESPLAQTLATHTLDEVCCSVAALESWAKFAARINAGMSHYREIILEGIQREGHNLIDAECLYPPELIASLFQELKSCRTGQYRQRCEAIASAEDITPKQYEKLKAQKSKTQAEWEQERKHALEDRYQVPVTPELVFRDDAGWYPQIRLFYYLTVGRQHLQSHDRKNLEGEAHNNKLWIPTFNRGQIGVAIRTLEVLGVPALLNPNKLFSKCSATVVEIADKAKAFARGIKDTLNLTISAKMTPIQVVQTLLGKIGIKLAYVGKYTLHPDEERFDLPADGERSHERCYAFVEVEDGREAVYARWLERDEANLTRSEYELDTPPNKDQLQEVAV